MANGASGEWTSPAAVAVTAVGSLLGFLAVLWVGPSSPDPVSVARVILEAARSEPLAGPDLADRLDEVLPAGVQARVQGPVPRGGPGAVAVAGDRVVVLSDPGERDEALAELARGGAVTTAAEGQWWLAVTAPDQPSRLPAALAAAVLCAVTGLAAAALRPFGTPAASSSEAPAAAPSPPQPPLAAPLGGELLPSTPPPPTRSTDSDLRAVRRQRDDLVRGLGDLAAQLPEGLDWQVNSLIESAGLRVVTPDGELFDPTLHHAVGTEAAPDPARAETVARTIRPGFTDGDRVLVPARVVVYALDESMGAPR